jgi:ABC-type glycerol-3-phosphate transport system substrate-binding protein
MAPAKGCLSPSTPRASKIGREMCNIKKEGVMNRTGWRMVVILATMMLAVAALPGTSVAQQKKLVLWTHWDQNPDFNKWYADKGKEFAKKTGYEVEVVTIPYQGYEAKYLAALMAKSSAPTSSWG